MSWQAMEYVKKLKACEDGAELTPEQKCLLYTLADYHQGDSRAAWRKRDELAGEALISVATMKRYLVYLEEHCVIERRFPEKQGRGDFCRYVFLRLDDPERLRERLGDKQKGLSGEPLFKAQKGLNSEPLSCAEGVQKGFKIEGKRGSEGAQNRERNKEATTTESKHQPQPTAGVTKSALDSLPEPRLQAFTAELRKIEFPCTVGWTPRQIASASRDRAFRAAIRAGIWEHVAIRIAQESYEAELRAEAVFGGGR